MVLNMFDVCMWFERSGSTSDLQCALLSPANHLYLGGLQTTIIELDLEGRREVRVVSKAVSLLHRISPDPLLVLLLFLLLSNLINLFQSEFVIFDV